jgi:hypothetical protein
VETIFSAPFFYGGKNILKRADHDASQHAEDGSPDDPIGYAHV